VPLWIKFGTCSLFGFIIELLVQLPWLNSIGMGAGFPLADVAVPRPRIWTRRFGRNLQDHAMVSITWSCTRSFPVHRVDRPLNKFLAGAEWLLTRGGLAASNHFETGGLIRGNENVDYPNLQYHFGPTGCEYQRTKLKLTQAFTLQVDQLRPQSHGHIAYFLY